MLTYRFYFAASNEHSIGASVLAERADDAAALLKANELALLAPQGATTVEVWENKRLVGRLPAGPNNSG
jgi:hypothetical protein